MMIQLPRNRRADAVYSVILVDLERFGMYHSPLSFHGLSPGRLTGLRCDFSDATDGILA